MEHPTVDELRAYVQANLGGGERAGLEAHLRSCAQCIEQLELIEAALAMASAASDWPMELPESPAGQALTRHRHLSGNDARLEAALLNGLRDSTEPHHSPRAPHRRRQTIIAVLAAAASLLVGPLIWRAVDLQPQAPVAFMVEGQPGQERSLGPTPSGLVQADTVVSISPGQSVRVAVDVPVDGWLYAVGVDGGNISPMPGVSAQGMQVRQGQRLTLPEDGVAPWAPAGEPGDIHIAILIAPDKLDEGALSNVPGGEGPWTYLEAVSDHHLYRGVLRYGDWGGSRP